MTNEELLDQKRELLSVMIIEKGWCDPEVKSLDKSIRNDAELLLKEKENSIKRQQTEIEFARLTNETDNAELERELKQKEMELKINQMQNETDFKQVEINIQKKSVWASLIASIAGSLAGGLATGFTKMVDTRMTINGTRAILFDQTKYAQEYGKLDSFVEKTCTSTFRK